MEVREADEDLPRVAVRAACRTCWVEADASAVGGEGGRRLAGGVGGWFRGVCVATSKSSLGQHSFCRINYVSDWPSRSPGHNKSCKTDAGLESTRMGARVHAEVHREVYVAAKAEC